MIKSNNFISTLNYYSNNQTCHLFYSNTTSIIIDLNYNSSFIFINQSTILITLKTITSSTTTTIAQPVTKPSCSACNANIYNRYSNSSGTFQEPIGAYSCETFCTGKLSSGASGATDPTYNYGADAITALNGAVYTCNIRASLGAICLNSYGNASSFSGLFFAINGGVCNTPYGGYRCCCKSSSG
ncbi:hypothetical protein I4U23_011691 [Adineta vaga]|nr:hypothetical protein I4U23_011691 [Adineta vaga]